MNYQFFDSLYARYKCDEIKVIGKNIERSGKWYHVMELTLKDKNVQGTNDSKDSREGYFLI